MAFRKTLRIGRAKWYAVDMPLLWTYAGNPVVGRPVNIDGALFSPADLTAAPFSLTDDQIDDPANWTPNNIPLLFPRPATGVPAQYNNVGLDITLQKLFSAKSILVPPNSRYGPEYPVPDAGAISFFALSAIFPTLKDYRLSCIIPNITAKASESLYSPLILNTLLNNRKTRKWYVSRVLSE